MVGKIRRAGLERKLGILRGAVKEVRGVDRRGGHGGRMDGWRLG